MKKCFSVMGSFATVTIAAIVILFVSGISDFTLAGMLVTFGWLMVGKLMLAMTFMQGSAMFKTLDLAQKKKNGVNIKNDADYWALKIFKAPALCVILLGVILVPTILLLWASFAVDSGHSYVDNVRAFALVAAISEIVAYTHWATHWRDYLYGSEYNARMEFQAKNYSPEKIEDSIMILRRMGIFGV